MNMLRRCQNQNQVKEIENGQQPAHRSPHPAKQLLRKFTLSPFKTLWNVFWDYKRDLRMIGG